MIENLASYFPVSDPTWIFFIVVSIILFAPMLLHRLRIPSIVGLIFAGILIGPHGLHILDRDSSFQLFGKVGLYYIMFLASLEMNLQDVRKIKKKAVFYGLLCFGVPFSLGLLGNALFLTYSFAASVLIACMYASQTLVAYPIVLRYGLTHQRSVNIAVGGTIFTDTLTLLVLAVVGGMFKGENGGWYWIWLLVKVIALGAIIIYTFPRIGRWFFRRYHDHVVQYVFVLGLVFLGAGLMEFVGMEGILGAFLAGIVLNRLIPPSSPLMNYVAFVGNALFIPYFLIGVGMIIDVKTLFKGGEALKIASVIIALAVLGKWLAAQIMRRTYRMSGLEADILFGLSNARAAAALAIVLVGHSIKLPGGDPLLDDNIFNATMLLILVSCIISSFVTERASYHTAIQVPAGTEIGDEGETKVMIAFSESSIVEGLVDLAMMTRMRKTDPPLVGLNVVLEDEVNLRAKGRRMLERAVQISQSGHITMQTQSRWAVNIASGLIHAVKEFDATDLILGLHRKKTEKDTFYGNVAPAVINGLPFQVMLYRPIDPIALLKKIHVVVPCKAELEPGFTHWIDQIVKISDTIGRFIDFYTCKETIRHVREYIERRHPRASLLMFHERNNWGTITATLPMAVRRDHLLVFVTARRGSVSYAPCLEHLQELIENDFSENNLLIIYPEQYSNVSGRKILYETKMK